MQHLRENKHCAQLRDDRDDIVEACGNAWRFLVNDPEPIRSIGHRNWSCVNFKEGWHHIRCGNDQGRATACGGAVGIRKSVRTTYRLLRPGMRPQAREVFLALSGGPFPISETGLSDRSSLRNIRADAFVKVTRPSSIAEAISLPAEPPSAERIDCGMVVCALLVNLLIIPGFTLSPCEGCNDNLCHAHASLSLFMCFNLVPI